MKKIFLTLGLLLFGLVAKSELMDEVAPFSGLIIKKISNQSDKDRDYSHFLKISLAKTKSNLYWEDDLITWKSNGFLHINLPTNGLADHGELGAIQSFRLDFFSRKASRLFLGFFLEQHVPQGDPLWTGRQNYEAVCGIMLVGRM